MLYDSTETFDDQQLGYAFTTESDSSGSYTLTNVRPGTYNVVAYPLAGQGSENLATSTVTVTAGRPNFLTGKFQDFAKVF